MDIQKQLEKEHSKKSTEKIVSFVAGDLKKFDELLDIFLHGEKRMSQRAAWPLSYVGIEHPQMIQKHMPELLKKLGEPEIHDAVKRNILRTFQEMEIPEKYEAIVIDTCFRFIRSETQAIAIRAFAITTASHICKKYPELQGELRILLSEIAALPHSAAIGVRIKKALKELGRGNPTH